MDGGWKQIIEDYFAEFLRFYFPAVHARIDFEKEYEYLDKDLAALTVDAAAGNRVVDKLVRVHWKSGRSDWILIHVEVQSRSGEDFAARMCRYNCRIWDRHDRDVLSLAVLADGDPDFRPCSHERAIGPCRLTFAYPIVKILDHKTEAELRADSSPMAAVSLMQRKQIEAGTDVARRFSYKIAQTRDLLARRGLNAVDVGKLFRFLDYLFRLPNELETQYRDHLHAIEEEMNVPYVTGIERLAREEGREEGREQGLRESVLDAVRIRFGEVPTQLSERIMRCGDVERLRALLRQALTAKSADDLRF